MDKFNSNKKHTCQKKRQHKRALKRKLKKLPKKALSNNMVDSKYKCPKCGNSEYDSGEIRTTGGFWTKIFNIQSRKFVSISCKKCGYSELYSNMSLVRSLTGARTAENILDFFTN